MTDLRLSPTGQWAVRVQVLTVDVLDTARMTGTISSWLTGDGLLVKA